MNDEGSEPRKLDYAEPERATARDRVAFLVHVLAAIVFLFITVMLALAIIGLLANVHAVIEDGNKSVWLCALSLPLVALISLATSVYFFHKAFFAPLPSQLEAGRTTHESELD